MSHLVKSDFVPIEPRAWKERKRKRKMVAIPNRSLSISKIVERFTRGLDAGVSVAETSNHPDSKVDLERLSRMDRVEKAYMAEELKAENEQKIAQFNEDVRQAREEEDRLKKERIAAKKLEAKKADPPRGGSASAGIGGA